MKYFLFAIVLLLGLHADAQRVNVRKVEISVYDLQGKRIGTGKIKAVTDTSMHFKPYYREMTEIHYQKIGMLKTKPPSGNGILIGAATGAGLGALFGIAGSSGINTYASAFSDDDEINKGESAVFGALLGGVLGAGLGWIVDATNKQTYRIRGKKPEWDDFKLDLKGFEAEEISEVYIDKPEDRFEANSPSTDSINQTDLFTNQDWRVFETGTFSEFTR